jgi:hypothetical protein
MNTISISKDINFIYENFIQSSFLIGNQIVFLSYFLNFRKINYWYLILIVNQMIYQKFMRYKFRYLNLIPNFISLFH